MFLRLKVVLLNNFYLFFFTFGGQGGVNILGICETSWANNGDFVSDNFSSKLKDKLFHTFIIVVDM